MPTVPPELRAKRFPLHLPVKYRSAGEKRWSSGTTENVSCSGMLIRGRRPLSPASRIELMLTMPSELAGEAQVVALCNGEVVRQHVRKPSRNPVLGVSVSACELLKSTTDGEQPSIQQQANANLPRIVQGLYDMLVIVVGSSEIILADTEAGENVKQHAAFIRTAAVRGAALLTQIRA